MLVEPGPTGLRVVAASPSALQSGVVPGLAFTDARARVPTLLHEEIDRTADARALRSLAQWMLRFTPLVALNGDDALMLETTGCAHLHHGEPGLVKQVSEVLSRAGIDHRIGLAGTQGAASALARAASGCILPDGEERNGLKDLPISALRLSEAAETLLRRFGLIRIGQLYGIDRKALARRFQSREMADAVLFRLDQALGLRHEPLHPLRPVPACLARLPCPEPLGTLEGLRVGLETLTQALCADLASRGEGASGFSLHTYRSDGTTGSASIRSARPIRTPNHILRLFAERLERIDPGFGIDLLVLEAHRTGPMETGAVALSGDLAAEDTDIIALSALADRITARFGEGVVTQPAFTESHRPERAETLTAFAGELTRTRSPNPQTGPRPLRVFQSPERVDVLAEVPDGPPLRFVWRRIARKVARADGPERIAPEWWQHTAPPSPASPADGLDRRWLTPKLDPRADADLIRRTRAEFEAMQAAGDETDAGEPVRLLPRARDYYRVEDEEGRRYWIFREGLYGDGRGAAPDWFVHGVFA